jgi:hypothetical protein
MLGSDVRWATVALLTLVACTDLREFRGDWRGSRVGDAPVLHLGMDKIVTAELEIGMIDEHHLSASVTIDGLVPRTPISSLMGADADVLAGLSFAGSPLHVYLAFVDVPDGNGQALVMIALYDDRRVEVRVMRGGTAALYGIFALTESHG